MRITKLHRAIIVFSVVIISLSCNTERHYKTLSLFFDGVPQPQIADTTSKIETATLKHTAGTRMPSREISAVYPSGSIHPDYQDKECGSCHEASSSNQLSDRQPEICYQCHDDFSETFARLHGPVAAGFCTTCHFPHKSEHEALLVRPLEEVCQHCHEQEDVNKNMAHKDISQVLCVSCHDPHGGATAHLLKAKES